MNENETIDETTTPETEETTETTETQTEEETPEVEVEEEVEEVEDAEPETRNTTSTKKETKEDDDDVDPDDEKVINNIVNKAVNPIREQLQTQLDQAEISNFITGNPEYAKYTKQIGTYMKHEAYRNIPIQNIAAIVSAKDMQKLGAKKERDAQAKVAETKGAGNNTRAIEAGAKDWGSASKEDYQAHLAKVMGQTV